VAAQNNACADIEDALVAAKTYQKSFAENLIQKINRL
jgi:hypothetical protein